MSVDELEKIVQEKYNVDSSVTKHIFSKVDIDNSNSLIAGEIVDFRLSTFIGVVFNKF